MSSKSHTNATNDDESQNSDSESSFNLSNTDKNANLLHFLNANTETTRSNGSSRESGTKLTKPALSRPFPNNDEDESTIQSTSASQAFRFNAKSLLTKNFDDSDNDDDNNNQKQNNVNNDDDDDNDNDKIIGSNTIATMKKKEKNNRVFETEDDGNNGANDTNNDQNNDDEEKELTFSAGTALKMQKYFTDNKDLEDVRSSDSDNDDDNDLLSFNVTQSTVSQSKSNNANHLKKQKYISSPLANGKKISSSSTKPNGISNNNNNNVGKLSLNTEKMLKEKSIGQKKTNYLTSDEQEKINDFFSTKTNSKSGNNSKSASITLKNKNTSNVDYSNVDNNDEDDTKSQKKTVKIKTATSKTIPKKQSTVSGKPVKISTDISSTNMKSIAKQIGVLNEGQNGGEIEEQNGEESCDEKEENSDNDFGFNKNGYTTFAPYQQNLESTPSVVGKINPKTKKPFTVADEQNIPYHVTWIMDRVHRYMRLLANPIFAWLRKTARKVNLSPDAFLAIPDSTLSGSFSKSFTTQFFKRNNLGDYENQRKRNIEKIRKETEQKIEEKITQNEKILELQNKLENKRIELKVQQDKLAAQKDNISVAENTENRTKESNLLKEIAAFEKQIKLLKEQLRQQYAKENITELVSRLENPEASNKVITDFLGKLGTNPDPKMQAFINNLEQQALENFVEPQGGDSQIPISEVRANAQRLWLLAPENLGMFFWDGTIDAAIGEALTSLATKTKKKYNQFHLITDDELVSELFSQLVSKYILKYRISDGSRNVTKELKLSNEREIVSLCNLFKNAVESSRGKLCLNLNPTPQSHKRKEFCDADREYCEEDMDSTSIHNQKKQNTYDDNFGRNFFLTN